MVGDLERDFTAVENDGSVADVVLLHLVVRLVKGQGFG